MAILQVVREGEKDDITTSKGKLWRMDEHFKGDLTLRTAELLGLTQAARLQALKILEY